MKKLTFLLLIVLNLFVVASHSQTVYITNTGEKYHRGDCRYLSRSKIETNLKDALEGGYEPCKVCHPPTTITVQKTKTVDPENNNESKEKAAVSFQCSENTKSGTRCKNKTKSTNGKCYQHGG